MVAKLMTLNDLERRNGRYFALAYFIEFGTSSCSTDSFKRSPKTFLFQSAY